MGLLRGSLVLTGGPAPMRVAYAQNAQVPGVSAGGVARATPAAGSADTTLSNILKLVPAEVVAPFIAGANTLKDNPDGRTIWFSVCLVIGLLVRGQATRPQQSDKPWFKQVQWRVVAVSGAAFVIWANAVVEQPLSFVPWHDQTIAGLLAMLFGAVAPSLVPGTALRE